MTKKKMGSIGKLSQFSGIKRQEEATPTTPEPLPTSLESFSADVPLSSAKPKEKLVTVNIKISRTQHQWLSDTARTVRENNSEPVPPSERVFPQHLIGVAIDLLQKSTVDWSQVRNVEDLLKHLNI